MDRLAALVRQVQPDVGESAGALAPVSASTAAVKPYPPGKHYVTKPTERLARYEGDGTKNGGLRAVTVHEKFMERVRLHGDRMVLCQKRGARDGPWTSWTWKQYHSEVVTVAKAFMALGCAQFEAINILGFNSPEWAFATFGGIFSGLTPAGIYITNGPDGVEYILDHSKCRVIFVDSDVQLQKVLAVRLRCPALKAIVHWGPDCPKPGAIEGVMSWDAFRALAAKTTDAALDARMAAMHPDNACYLSYTSGTTGNPKAVMYCHDNVTWGMAKLYDIILHNAGGKCGLEEREISYMPLSHIAGNVQILGGVTLPAHVNVCIYFAFPDAMQGSLPVTLNEVRPTLWLAVPRVWEKLTTALQDALRKKPELKNDSVAFRGLVGLDQARTATTGAAPIQKGIMEFWQGIGLPIMEVYGMTENTAYSHYAQLGKMRIGSVGPALCDEDAGSKLAEGSNEICTWSRGVMMGYMYNEEKSRDTFDDEGFLRTGDIGEVDADGFWYIVGRIKEMIITAGGENMAPVLLEDAIKLRLPAISNAVMIGDRQKYLIAMLTLKLEPDGKGGFTDKLAPEAKAVDPACATFADAMNSATWKEYLTRGIEEANKVAISRAQHTRKFVVLPGDFSPVGELPELTSTMKLRREIVAKKYLQQIRDTYGEDYAEK